VLVARHRITLAHWCVAANQAVRQNKTHCGITPKSRRTMANFNGEREKYGVSQTMPIWETEGTAKFAKAGSFSRISRISR
jgi:hypothetical protein